MPKVRIVTDSSAHFFDPEFPARHNVTVVPLTIRFGQQALTDGPDLPTEALLAQVASGAPIPTAEAPSARQFAAVYEDICRTNDTILSIHISGKLSRTLQNARGGADEVLG